MFCTLRAATSGILLLLASMQIVHAGKNSDTAVYNFDGKSSSEFACEECAPLANIADVQFSEKFYWDLFLHQHTTKKEFEEQLGKLLPEKIAALPELAHKERKGSMSEDDRKLLKNITSGITALANVKNARDDFQSGGMGINWERTSLIINYRYKKTLMHYAKREFDDIEYDYPLEDIAAVDAAYNKLTNRVKTEVTPIPKFSVVSDQELDNAMVSALEHAFDEINREVKLLVFGE